MKRRNFLQIIGAALGLAVIPVAAAATISENLPESVPVKKKGSDYEFMDMYAEIFNENGKAVPRWTRWNSKLQRREKLVDGNTESGTWVELRLGDFNI